MLQAAEIEAAIQQAILSGYDKGLKDGIEYERQRRINIKDLSDEARNVAMKLVEKSQKSEEKKDGVT